MVRVTRFEGMIAIGGVREAEVPPRAPSVGPRNVFDHTLIAMVYTRLVVHAPYLLIAAEVEMITRQKVPDGAART